VADGRSSNKFHPQLPPDSLCGACEFAEGHGFIVGAEKPIQLRAACLHALRQFGLGNALVFRKGVKLARDHTLDGARGDLFINALLFQKVVKRRSDSAFLFM
jgi:hypothetical protein